MRGRHTRNGHRRSRRWLRVGIFALAGFVVLGGGAAYATYRYEESQAGKVLPGVTIAGVDVGGMTREEAIDAVNEVAGDRLDREIEVAVRDRTWHVTPAELGTTADVEGKVDAALAVGERMGWHERAWARLFDGSVDENLSLDYSRDGKELRRFVRVVAKAVAVSPQNASVELEGSKLVLDKPRMGIALKEKQAKRSLRRSLRRDRSSVRLAVDKIEPEVGKGDLGWTIVVRISQNKLYAYEGTKLVKTYEVATGTSEYPTPQGTWNIWDKRESPTWVNPAPDGWGADLPATIGPGPGNPLGTHALYLDAPGIRIHGTYAESSIGTYASHGCIRMRIAESKELFSMIPIGTTVHIIQ